MTALPIALHSRNGVIAQQNSVAGSRLLQLDRQMPSWDATRVERRVIDARPELVFDAALNTDFIDAARTNGAVRVLFRVRSAAEELIAWARRSPRPRARAPRMLRVGMLPLRGQWVTLGQEWPREIAFGAIGRFWAGETKFITTDASVFRHFRAPGFAKIGCHMSFRALGDGRTLVTYESRTQATDPASRRAFLRYWRVVSPFVGVVMRAMLSAIERSAKKPGL